jgi:hypothetical protein
MQVTWHVGVSWKSYAITIIAPGLYREGKNSGMRGSCEV